MGLDDLFRPQESGQPASAESAFNRRYRSHDRFIELQERAGIASMPERELEDRLIAAGQLSHRSEDLDVITDPQILARLTLNMRELMMSLNEVKENPEEYVKRAELIHEIAGKLVRRLPEITNQELYQSIEKAIDQYQQFWEKQLNG